MLVVYALTRLNQNVDHMQYLFSAAVSKISQVLIGKQRISDGLTHALSNKGEYLAEGSFSLAKYTHIPGIAQLHSWLQQSSAMWYGSFRTFDNEDKQDLITTLMQYLNI